MPEGWWEDGSARKDAAAADLNSKRILGRAPTDSVLEMLLCSVLSALSSKTDLMTKNPKTSQATIFPGENMTARAMARSLQGPLPPPAALLPVGTVTKLLGKVLTTVLSTWRALQDTYSRHTTHRFFSTARSFYILSVFVKCITYVPYVIDEEGTGFWAAVKACDCSCPDHRREGQSAQ